MSVWEERDDDLVALLRALPSVPPRARERADDVLGRAERHGVAGIVAPALRAWLSADVERAWAQREAARAMDHDAHRRALARIDAELREAGLRAVALKGALLAMRLYPEPSTRATSDIDLMVAEDDLERALAAFACIGYVQDASPDEARFRREHHHLHLHSEWGPPLELHFHAYRGFGAVLRSEPLLARSVPAPGRELGSIRVLDPADELVYLAVHAAAHRFVRIGWIYDLVLLVRTMDDAQLVRAAERAVASGFDRPLALAMALVERLGVPPAHLARVRSRTLGGVRRRVLERITREPEASLRRSATRLVYGAALCGSWRSAARHVGEATLARGRRLIGA